MTEPVVIEITLPAPVAEVWQAFRDPALIHRWFGWDYDGLEDEIRMIFVDGTVAAEADRTLHIGGHLLTLDDQGPQTVVRVTRAAPVDPNDGMIGTRSTTTSTTMAELPAAAALRTGPPPQSRPVRPSTETGRRSGRHPFRQSSSSVWPVSARRVGTPSPPRPETSCPGRSGSARSASSGSPSKTGATGSSWSPSRRRSDPRTGGASIFLCTYGLDLATLADLEFRRSAWWNGHFRSGAGN